MINGKRIAFNGCVYGLRVCVRKMHSSLIDSMLYFSMTAIEIEAAAAEAAMTFSNLFMNEMIRH